MKKAGAGDEEFLDLSDGAAAEEETRLHAVLSNADVLAARAKARAKLEKERYAAAMKAEEERETERLRREEGLVTGDGAKDEMVELTLDLAPHSQNITINGQAYWHGHTVTVPRHVADTLRDMQARGWNHQDETDGKDRAQRFQANRQVKMALVKGSDTGAKISYQTGAVRNAPKSFAAEELRA